MASDRHTVQQSAFVSNKKGESNAPSYYHGGSSGMPTEPSHSHLLEQNELLTLKMDPDEMVTPKPLPRILPASRGIASMVSRLRNGLERVDNARNHRCIGQAGIPSSRNHCRA
jgi:hypothetical protein